MASSSDGKLIFLAVVDCINVYESADFSSLSPPEPSTFFPFNPLRTLRPTPQQHRKIISRIPPGSTSTMSVTINHIRAGFIGDQESLVAVGEFGSILVWNVAKLEDEPVLMESSDFNSTWGIAMSPKNFLLATSSNSHSVTIFHYPTRRVIFSQTEESSETVPIRIHKHNIPSLDYSPCGKFLASCDIEGRVFLWSLCTGEISRIKSYSIEWGWLIRFVPSQQYDFRTSKGKFTKTFFHSNIKEVTHVPETTPNYIINDSDFEGFDENMSEAEIVLDIPFIDDIFAAQEEVHLAEGAGDTWPSDSEPEEIVDNREYSDYYDSEDYDFEDTSDYGSSDTNKSVYASDLTVNEKFKINLVNTDDISLFKPSPHVPFHLFYCASESISVFDPDGELKICVPKVRKFCKQIQSDDLSLTELNFGMQFLQYRLAMGEWINELGIFFVVDCIGQVFISSPKTNPEDGHLDLDTTIMIPESLEETSPIIGYTLIKRFDEEYAIKFHLYVICENGWFKLYEIVKK